jgi:hypothetical protein
MASLSRKATTKRASTSAARISGSAPSHYAAAHRAAPLLLRMSPGVVPAPKHAFCESATTIRTDQTYASASKEPSLRRLTEVADLIARGRSTLQTAPVDTYSRQEYRKLHVLVFRTDTSLYHSSVEGERDCPGTDVCAAV